MQGGSGSQSALAEMPDFLPDASEAGTHNVSGIHALAAGLDFVQSLGLGTILHHEAHLRRLLARGLREIPGALCFTGGAQSGVVSFLYGAEDCEQTAQRLCESGIAVRAGQGICVRAGLHCAPLAHRSAGTAQSGTVRVSFSVFNCEEEVAAFLRAVKK